MESAISKGDIKNNSKSIRELMKRLSLPSTSFYSSSSATEDPATASASTLDTQSQTSPLGTQPPSQQQQQMPLNFISPSSSSNSLSSLSCGPTGAGSVPTTIGGANPIAALAQISVSASNSSTTAGGSAGSNPAMSHQASVASNLSSMSSSLSATPAGLLIAQQQAAAAAAAASGLVVVDDDNNPFDVAENRDYFKSNQHVDEIKQLIINVMIDRFSFCLLVFLFN